MIAYVVVLKMTTWSAIRWTRTLRPLLIMNFSDGTHVSFFSWLSFAIFAYYPILSSNKKLWFGYIWPLQISFGLLLTFFFKFIEIRWLVTNVIYQGIVNPWHLFIRTTILVVSFFFISRLTLMGNNVELRAAIKTVGMQNSWRNKSILRCSFKWKYV